MAIWFASSTCQLVGNDNLLNMHGYIVPMNFVSTLHINVHMYLSFQCICILHEYVDQSQFMCEDLIWNTSVHFSHTNSYTMVNQKHSLVSYRKSTIYQRNVCARTHLLIVLPWNLPLSGHHACMPPIETCTGLTVVIWVPWIVPCMHTRIW